MMSPLAEEIDGLTPIISTAEIIVNITNFKLFNMILSEYETVYVKRIYIGYTGH